MRGLVAGVGEGLNKRLQARFKRVPVTPIELAEFEPNSASSIEQASNGTGEQVKWGSPSRRTSALTDRPLACGHLLN